MMRIEERDHGAGGKVTANQRSETGAPASEMSEEELPESLRPFAAIRSSFLLTMAPIATVHKGIELFQNDWATHLSVPRPGRLEALRVEAEVNIWAEDGLLKSSCNCREAHLQTHCRHACCLFAGTMAVLHGKIPGGAIPKPLPLSRFRQAFYPQSASAMIAGRAQAANGRIEAPCGGDHRHEWPAIETGNAEASTGYDTSEIRNRLELHCQGSYMIRWRGTIPKTLWDALGPLALFRTQSYLPLLSSNMMETLQKLLRAGSVCKIPMVFCRGNRVSPPLAWRQRSGKWQAIFNRTSSGDVAAGLAFTIAGTPVPVLDDLGGAGAILHSGEIVEAEPSIGEKVIYHFNRYDNGYKEEGPLSHLARWESVLDPEDFNAISVGVNLLGSPEAKAEMRLFDGDRAVQLDAADSPPLKLQPVAQIIPDPDGEGSIVKMDAEGAGLKVPLARFCEEVAGHFFNPRLSGPILRNRQRMQALAKAAEVLHSAATSNDARALVRTMFKEETLFSRGMLPEVFELLEEYYRRFVDQNEAQSCRILAPEEGGWCLARLPLTEVARAIVALPELFGRLTSIPSPARRHEAPSLSSREIATRLLPIMKNAGGRVEVGGRPVTSRKFQIGVDVTRTGGDATGGRSDEIDWFELRPAVRCDSFTIPEEEWEQLILGGMFETGDGGLAIPDEESLAALRRVVTLLGGGRKSSTKKEKEGLEENPGRAHTLEMIEWLNLRKHGVEVNMPPDIAALMDSLTNFKTLPHAKLARGFKAELRPYQRQGFDWLAFLYTHRLGACLADDMGLGKTLQAGALLLSIQKGFIPAVRASYLNHPHLIVVPPSLLFNWQSELQKFCPELRVAEYAGARRCLPEARRADVVLTTYDVMRIDIERLAEEPFHVAVFDEAQLMKNRNSDRAKAAARIKRAFTLCLTGTPVENHAGEYHSILNLALPGLLGDYNAFMQSIKESGNVTEAIARTRPVVLRRTKEEVLDDLPPKIEQDIDLLMTAEQREYYTRMVGEVKAEVLEAFHVKPAQQAGMIALTCLMRLRQICISPALLGRPLREQTPKFLYLLDKLAELRDEGHSAIIFSQFTGALDIACEESARAGLEFLRLDGSTPAARRKQLVETFQKSSAPLFFFISLKSGGVGLNLTRASYVFHLDPWWNPAVENQATDRAHRLGQKNHVFVQRLLMRDSVEEKMMRLKEKKRKIFDQILSGGEGRSPTGMITAEDVKFLLE